MIDGTAGKPCGEGMFRHSGTAFSLLVSCLLPPAIGAQEADVPSTLTYSTYHYCATVPQSEARLDEIVAKVDAPIFEALVEEGVISGWGWLAHQTGGLWRRIRYFQASTLDGLWAAQAAMTKRYAEADPALMAERFGICNQHEDYIWEVVAASTGTERAGSGLSIYFVCDQAGEERADEIVSKDFAPVFDKYVKRGDLASWGWSRHVIGGKYRRLQTMTAESHTAVLKARAAILREMTNAGVDSGPEFAEICGSHTDYLWDIQIESP